MFLSSHVLRRHTPRHFVPRLWDPSPGTPVPEPRSRVVCPPSRDAPTEVGKTPTLVKTSFLNPVYPCPFVFRYTPFLSAERIGLPLAPKPGQNFLLCSGNQKMCENKVPPGREPRVGTSLAQGVRAPPLVDGVEVPVKGVSTPPGHPGSAARHWGPLPRGPTDPRVRQRTKQLPPQRLAVHGPLGHGVKSCVNNEALVRASEPRGTAQVSTHKLTPTPAPKKHFWDTEDGPSECPVEAPEETTWPHSPGSPPTTPRSTTPTG